MSPPSLRGQIFVYDIPEALNAAIDKPELKLKGWTARGPARIPLLIGWLHARTSIEHVFIDLRECELTPQEGEQLGHLMAAHSILNAIDVRGNEGLGDHGATVRAVGPCELDACVGTYMHMYMYTYTYIYTCGTGPCGLHGGIESPQCQLGAALNQRRDSQELVVAGAQAALARRVPSAV